MRFNFKILVFFLFALIFTGAVLFYASEVEKEIGSTSLTNFAFPKKDNPPVYLKLFDDVKENYILSKKDFLEVNLDKMKIRLFKQGSLIKEVPILAKGDSKSWGGSAVGTYRIVRGYKLSYSNIEDVYMPYALHYYGKYYIHGEPYYPSGEKLESFFSGGCLRLKDEDAESIFQLSDLNMPVLVIDREKDQTDYKVVSQKPEISAESFLAADLDSGFVFAQKDSSILFPLASLTKLMTAVTIAENINLRRSVLIRQKMLDSGYGVTKGLDVEKRFRAVELFYPLLIESSNDAAFALTWLLGQERTIDLMNEKARSILMENTRFVGPSGFDPANISTAKDLFYLARYILNNRYPILEITKGNKVTSFGSVSFDIEKLWNKNIFIYDPTFIGGKTGYTKQSKHTALFLFKFEQRNVAIILLGSDNLRQDTQKLYIWLQKNYFN
ncbi:hypothetical protein AMJ47_01125 [Parcubacteria bacterium DG_72]|nr:MAG: hypothetical protein AMJ47_01125 [Parcubacteria bacterium DG_72]